MVTGFWRTPKLLAHPSLYSPTDSAVRTVCWGEEEAVYFLPPVTPSTLERGFDALGQARLAAEQALARPPQRFEEA